MGNLQSNKRTKHSCYWPGVFCSKNNHHNTEIPAFINNRIFTASEALSHWIFSLKKKKQKKTSRNLVQLNSCSTRSYGSLNQNFSHQVLFLWHLVLPTWPHLIPLTLLLGVCYYALSLREVVTDTSPSKWQSWDLNLGLPDTRCHVLNYYVIVPLGLGKKKKKIMLLLMTHKLICPGHGNGDVDTLWHMGWIPACCRI